MLPPAFLEAGQPEGPSGEWTIAGLVVDLTLGATTMDPV